MRGTWLRVGIAAAVLVGAFVLAVVILNQTVYGPAGFVKGYLDALVRKDAKAALALAGPSPSSSALDDLLTPEVMADLTDLDVRLDPDTTGLATGHRIVHVAFRADGVPGEAAFEVEDDGRILGLFDRWAFTDSPLMQVDLTVLHAREFSANGVERVTPDTDADATYLAFAPGAVTFASSTTYTEAVPQSVMLDRPGRVVDVQLVAYADAALIELAAAQAQQYLDACAAQPVLFPANCPFGQDVADRIARGSSPHWSITEYPSIALQPTSTLGQWRVVPAGGVAHLQARIRSIYDGSVSPLDVDVPFTIGYLATFVGADDLVLTPQP